MCPSPRGLSFMPTEPTDANNEAESSTASTEAQQQTDAATSQAAEESSTSKPGEQESLGETLAEVVQNTAKAHADAAAQQQKPTEQPKATSEVKEEPPTKPQVEEQKTDEEVEQPPFHEHPRWKEVTAERDTFKKEAEEAKPLVERQRALEQFCADHQVSNDDLKMALELAALSKINPVEAIKRLTSLTENLQVAQGQRLPADLQKDVDEGTLSLERAKQLAKLQLELEGSKNLSRNAQADAARQTTEQIVSSVDAWEMTKAKTDTAWAKKRPLVQLQLQALAQAKPPVSPAEAVALAEQALVLVNKHLGGFQPALVPRKVLSSQGSSTTATPELKLDSLDQLPALVRQVAARHR